MRTIPCVDGSVIYVSNDGKYVYQDPHEVKPLRLSDKCRLGECSVNNCRFPDCKAENAQSLP
jgi:hypothetical protein